MSGAGEDVRIVTPNDQRRGIWSREIGKRVESKRVRGEEKAKRE
jgi:hypothetical protein